MKLRTVILLVLFIFALTPMAALILLNLPVVLEKLETFVRRDQLQRMRVEFGDLDQFVAMRKEMVRVLTKLPDPGATLGTVEDEGGAAAQPPSEAFLQWVNHILRAGQDIYEVAYLDREGVERLRLIRRRLGAPLRLAEPRAAGSRTALFHIGMSLQPEGIFIGPIRLAERPQLDETFHPMTLPMVGPVLDVHGMYRGVIVVSMDVGGLPSAFPNTIWAMADGTVIPNASAPDPRANASEEFPGLDALFGEGVTGLWRGPDGAQAVWVPLFSTERYGPLWVGRRLDPSAVDTFRKAFRDRVLIITILLIICTLVVARWLAQRVALLGEDLKQKVKRVLNGESDVVFAWRGAAELQALAQDLTRLAAAHARNAQDLQVRANELENAYRYKSQFLANMSHELRTPLTSMLLLSKILAENDPGNLSAEQVRQCQVIHSAGRDLLALIDDILEISRTEAGRSTVHLQRIEVATFWKPLLEIFQPLAAEKGLTLQGYVEQDVPETLVTDEHRLCQILRNFLSNAVKFTDQGSIVLRVGNNGEEDAARRPVAFSVEDTGVGIASDKQDLIFEAFQQGDGSTSRRYGGSGLGLTICRSTAELLGGRISLTSEEGHGATFTLYLPLNVDTANLDVNRLSYDANLLRDTDSAQRRHSAARLPPAWSVARAEGGVRLHAANASPERSVLLLDEDMHRLLSLTPHLERWGLKVTAATSLQEALDVLDTEPTFALMIVHGGAPGVGGATGIRRLSARAQGGTQATVLIVVADTEAQRVDGPEVGAAAVLTPPVDPRALWAVLEETHFWDPKTAAVAAGQTK